MDLASLVSLRTDSACFWLSQKFGSAEVDSSSLIRFRLASTSKMPPELVDLCL